MANDPLQRKIKTFSNPILSIWQQALHKSISQKTPNAQLSSTQPQMTQFVAAADALSKGQAIPKLDSAGNVIGDCAKIAAEFACAEITHDTLKASELQDELSYSTCDPVWSTALAIYLAWKASLAAIPYVRYKNLSDFIIPLPDKPDLTIGFIADWGTGLPDAQWVLSEVLKKNPDVLIHLGDIYYAGTADDVRDHFLTIVRKAAPNIPVYTLSGNHDMYSGGAPFYWLIQQLNQGPGLQPFAQPASYFCLRSPNWQILAMDTGLHDCNPFTVQTNLTFLDPKEGDWHADKLKNSGGRKTVLLSHHQLFTAFGDGVGQNSSGSDLAYNPNLFNVFGPYINDVSLWLWGHEHNLEIFNPYLGLAKGRCVGASAIPVFSAENPYQPNPGLNLQGQKSLPDLSADVTKLNVNAQGVYFHNYAIMELHSPASAIRNSSIQYYQLDASNNGPSILTFGEDI